MIKSTDSIYINFGIPGEWYSGLIFFYKSILRHYLAYKYLMLFIFAFQDLVTKNYTHYLILELFFS